MQRQPTSTRVEKIIRPSRITPRRRSRLLLVVAAFLAATEQRGGAEALVQKNDLFHQCVRSQRRAESKRSSFWTNAPLRHLHGYAMEASIRREERPGSNKPDANVSRVAHLTASPTILRHRPSSPEPAHLYPSVPHPLNPDNRLTGHDPRASMSALSYPSARPVSRRPAPCRSASHGAWCRKGIMSRNVPTTGSRQALRPWSVRSGGGQQ